MIALGMTGNDYYMLVVMLTTIVVSYISTVTIGAYTKKMKAKMIKVS